MNPLPTIAGLQGFYLPENSQELMGEYRHTRHSAMTLPELPIASSQGLHTRPLRELSAGQRRYHPYNNVNSF